MKKKRKTTTTTAEQTNREKTATKFPQHDDCQLINKMQAN